VSYLKDGLVLPEEVRSLLRNGGFLQPPDDLKRTQRMLDKASFYITVRDGAILLGFTRILTDYAYYGMVTEVTVAKSHKAHDIGKELLRQPREYATPRMTLILTSSEEGQPFYEHLGWLQMERGFRIRREA